MKTRSNPAVAAALAATLLSGAAAGVSAHDGIDARLRGLHEVPAVSTVAKGRFKASVDDKSQSIRYELSYNGLEGTVTMAHIHFGQRDVNGGIMVWLCQTTTNTDPTGLAPTCPQSGSVSGVLQASNVVGPAGQGIAALEFAKVLAAIRAGAAYANVHSSKFPSGEIRAQVRDDD
jgi:hypothetical protein